MRVVAYVPSVPRAGQYQRDVIRLCTAEGVDLDLLTWTDDPAAARAMLDDGTACHIAVARPDHFREVYPELMVATPPRHRPGGAVAAGLLAGLATVGRRLWEHKLATAATAAMVGTMTAWPMISADLPELVPPPIAAPPPLEVYPDLPAPEPERPAEVVPPAQSVPVQPLPPAIELPELNPVAVELPAVPEPPAAPIPRATPPAPIPAPEPTLPVPPPEPVDPPPVDPQLPCYDLDLLGLAELRLCLQP